jgi:putative ABC transport system permease protein
VGADRWALSRTLLVESVLLAVAGGALGLVLARFGVGALLALSPDRLPRANEIQLDAGVVGFALVLSVVTGLLFGLAPALQGSRIALHDALREGGRSASASSGHSLRRVLIVLEVALALTLLVGAGLLLKSFARLQNVNPGFDPRNLLTFEISLPKARYSDGPSQARFFDDAFARIEQLPGVKAVGATTVMPFGGDWSTRSFNVEGLAVQPGINSPWGDIRLVTPRFFETLRVPLLRGRAFSDVDVPGGLLVAVVDDELARKYFAASCPTAWRSGRGRWASAWPWGRSAAACSSWSSRTGCVSPSPASSSAPRGRWRSRACCRDSSTPCGPPIRRPSRRWLPSWRSSRWQRRCCPRCARRGSIR